MRLFYPHDVSAWWQALKSVWFLIDEKNLSLIAAGVAFFNMLAIFPGLAALIALFGLVADPSVVNSQLELMQGLIPQDAYDLFHAQIATLLAARSDTLGIATAISVGLALWSARAGVAAIIRGLNAIYREPNRKGIWHYLAALALTLALIGLSLVALLAVVVAPIVLAFLPLGPSTAWMLELLRWGVAIFILLFSLGLLYRFGPNRRNARVAWITPGAILSLLLWVAASMAFSYYLTNFGNYNEVYGSIGAVVALLVWFYISAFLVLLGAALNVELELRTKPDSTVGPARPMGARGAFAADTYIES